MISLRARIVPALIACAFGLAGLAATTPAVLAQPFVPAPPQNNTVYAVTALDVSPGKAAQGVAALKQYRDAARRQPGNEGIDVLQEEGWPTRFVVFETWKDRPAYDANEKAAPLVELRDKLKPIADTPYDRRDYYAVAAAPAKAAAGAGAVFLQVHLDVFPPGLDRTIAAAKEIAVAARKGDGNLRYDLLEQFGQPRNHATLYAAWQSRAAFDAYQASNYGRHFRDVVGPLLGSPYDDRVYTLVN